MNPLREAAQQALEAMEYSGMDVGKFNRINAACAALRAALAQQDELQGCATEEDCTKQPWCRIRGECQRKQAEPMEPHRWEGDNNIESPFNACMHKTYCMTLKQAEPVGQLAELQAMLRAEVDRLIAAGIQPQRKLVPLTEEEIMHIGMTHQSLRQVARAIERAHGIKE